MRSAVMGQEEVDNCSMSHGHMVLSNSPAGLELVRTTTALNLCRSDSAGAESFGLYSCVINGEEKDQSHRAVYR